MNKRFKSKHKKTSSCISSLRSLLPPLSDCTWAVLCWKLGWPHPKEVSAVFSPLDVACGHPQWASASVARISQSVKHHHSRSLWNSSGFTEQNELVLCYCSSWHNPWCKRISLTSVNSETHFVWMQGYIDVLWNLMYRIVQCKDVHCKENNSPYF